MFLFDADKAANGGIFRELWAIVRNFAMTSGLRLAAAIIVLLLGLKIAKAVLKRYEKSRAFQKILRFIGQSADTQVLPDFEIASHRVHAVNLRRAKRI